MNNTQVCLVAGANHSKFAHDFGDRTTESVSTQHAISHGIVATDPVIEGRESREDWVSHRETVVRGLIPVGALETAYAGRAALYLWRLDRLTRFEATAAYGELGEGTERRCEESPGAQESFVLPDRSTLPSIIKYEAHLQRCLVQTMAELRRLQKERRQGLRTVEDSGSSGGAASGATRLGERIAAANPRVGGCQKEEQKEDQADRTTAGSLSKDQDANTCKDGSEGGSPSQTGSPIQPSSPAQDQDANKCKDGSAFCLGESVSPSRAPIRIEAPSQHGAPATIGAPRSAVSPARKHAPLPKRARARRDATALKQSTTPRTTPPINAFMNRHRLIDDIAGEFFMRDSSSWMLDIAMIPKPTTVG